MAGSDGWMSLNAPARTGRDAFRISPFNRLARVHAASTAADLVIAVALAGSLFFSMDPGQARWRVGLYLLLTLAPFAIVAPLIGPLIDRARGGSRWVIVATAMARVVVGFLMMRHLDGLLLFPEAFLMLVMAKGYSVAKTAYVPATVRDDAELVSANSKLVLISALAGPAAAAPAGLFHWLLGSSAVVGLATALFALTSVLSLRLVPAAEWSLAARAGHAAEAESASSGEEGPTAGRVGDGPSEDGSVGDRSAVPSVGVPSVGVPSVGEGPPDRGSTDGAGTVGGPEPTGATPGKAGAVSAPSGHQGLWLAASAMGLLRGIVGFLTFLLAFELRSKGGAAVGYGLVLAAAGIGNLVGAGIAPRVRRLLREDQMMGASLVTATAAATVAALLGGTVGALLVVAAVGVAGATAKLAFDALAQRDAPIAEKGRLLAQFEARFQMLWVVGAFIPVVVPLPARVGYLLIALLGAATAACYLLGRRSLGSMMSELAWGPSGRPPSTRAASTRRGADTGDAGTVADDGLDGHDGAGGRPGPDVVLPPGTPG